MTLAQTALSLLLGMAAGIAVYNITNDVVWGVMIAAGTGDLCGYAHGALEYYD